MKRIWMGGSIEKGMTRRRDAEAKIIEESLTNTVLNTKENIEKIDKIIAEKFKN
jgi:hypothetical protein